LNNPSDNPELWFSIIERAGKNAPRLSDITGGKYYYWLCSENPMDGATAAYGEFQFQPSY